MFLSLGDQESRVTAESRKDAMFVDRGSSPWDTAANASSSGSEDMTASVLATKSVGAGAPWPLWVLLGILGLVLPCDPP